MKQTRGAETAIAGREARTRECLAAADTRSHVGVNEQNGWSYVEQLRFGRNVSQTVHEEHVWRPGANRTNRFVDAKLGSAEVNRGFQRNEGPDERLVHFMPQRDLVPGLVQRRDQQGEILFDSSDPPRAPRRKANSHRSP
jgi:hypothetical protein